MNWLIELYREFMANAPWYIRLTLIALITILFVVLTELIVLQIVWTIQDIKDRPERKKRREEIDSLIAEVKKDKQDKKDCPVIKMLLYEDLKKYCNDNHIPLRYGELWFKELQEASGFISYLIDRDKEEGYSYKIHIRKTDDEDINGCNVWTLAHELGHFESIGRYKDRSEKGADYEARKLCESFLTQQELDNEYFQIALGCFTMELEEMKKFEHINNLLED